MSPYRTPANGYDLCAPPPTPEGKFAEEAVRTVEGVFEHFGLEHDTAPTYLDALLRAGRGGR